MDRSVRRLRWGSVLSPLVLTVFTAAGCATSGGANPEEERGASADGGSDGSTIPTGGEVPPTPDAGAPVVPPPAPPADAGGDAARDSGPPPPPPPQFGSDCSDPNAYLSKAMAEVQKPNPRDCLQSLCAVTECCWRNPTFPTLQAVCVDL